MGGVGFLSRMFLEVSRASDEASLRFHNLKNAKAIWDGQFD